MAAGILIGNDIVDLTHPRMQRRLASDRFRARVLTDAERTRIEASGRPSLTLWTVWAAKEAAFKVATKLGGRAPVFRHRAFETRMDGDGDRAGIVTWEGHDFPFEVVRSDEWVDVVAYPAGRRSGARIRRGVAERSDGVVEDACPPGSACFDAFLRDQFTLRERRSVRGHPGALTRLRARSELADWLGVREVRLEIVCGQSADGRTPPVVLLDGGSAGVDLSLSHHGRWVSWAFAAWTH